MFMSTGSLRLHCIDFVILLVPIPNFFLELISVEIPMSFRVLHKIPHLIRSLPLVDLSFNNTSIDMLPPSHSVCTLWIRHDFVSTLEWTVGRDVTILALIVTVFFFCWSALQGVEVDTVHCNLTWCAQRTKNLHHLNFLPILSSLSVPRNLLVLFYGHSKLSTDSKCLTE